MTRAQLLCELQREGIPQSLVPSWKNRIEQCLFDPLELDLFTKYLREAREDNQQKETTSPTKLDTHTDVGRAYAKQHMPTIPQFYEQVWHEIRCIDGRFQRTTYS